MLSSEEGKEESDTVSWSDNEENSEDDLAIADLYEQPIVQMPFLTFVPDEQIAEVTVEARTEWKKNRQTNKNNCTKWKWKKETERWPMLALPDCRIPANYLILNVGLSPGIRYGFQTIKDMDQGTLRLRYDGFVTL